MKKLHKNHKIIIVIKKEVQIFNRIKARQFKETKLRKKLWNKLV